MQLQTPPRSLGLPANTLRYLRRLANLTVRYCDRVDAEKDEYTRERNYKQALRRIFRIQKTLYDSEFAINDLDARAKIAEISDALLGAWDSLADRAPCLDCNRLGTLAYLAVKSAENFDTFKTPFYYTLSELKQRTN